MAKKVKAKQPEPEVDEDVEEDEEASEDEEGDDEGEVKETKSRNANKVIKLKRLPKDEDGGPQVQGILKCLLENDKQMTYEELSGELGKYITTKQPVMRIFQFYRKALEDAGAIEIR